MMSGKTANHQDVLACHFWFQFILLHLRGKHNSRVKVCKYNIVSVKMQNIYLSTQLMLETTS